MWRRFGLANERGGNGLALMARPCGERDAQQIIPLGLPSRLGVTVGNNPGVAA
jgi:hypothetical protein